MNPEVSIIVPVYNVEPYIANTMKSLCEQTYRRFEVILVDDGSKDASIEIAQKQLQKTPDITYKIIKQHNSGQGCARNRGVNEASGNWIMFMDSDDTIQKRMLDRMLSLALKEKCDVVFSDFQKVQQGHEFREISYDHGYEIMKSEILQHKFLMREFPAIVPGTLYNAKWYREKGLKFEEIRFSEDIHFLWSAIIAAQKIGYIHATLYNYVTRPNSTMTKANMQYIIASYDTFCSLNENIRMMSNTIDEVMKWMLDRWVLGVLRTSAVNFEWYNFEKVFIAVDGKRHMEHMKGFPEKRARILAQLIKLSPKCYYEFMRRWGKW